MRQRRREARARPTLPARPAAGGASCAVPREGAADATPSPGLGGGGRTLLSPGGGGLLGSPWGPQVRLQIGRLRERETPARRRLHKGRGPGPRRGAPGWGCGGAARTQRRRAGGSALTGPAGAVMPAARRPGRAKRARPRSRPGSLSGSGRGAAPWNRLGQGRLPRAAPAQRSGSPHTLGPGALGGRGVCCPPLTGAAGRGLARPPGLGCARPPAGRLSGGGTSTGTGPTAAQAYSIPQTPTPGGTPGPRDSLDCPARLLAAEGPLCPREEAQVHHLT